MKIDPAVDSKACVKGVRQPGRQWERFAEEADALIEARRAVLCLMGGAVKPFMPCSGRADPETSLRSVPVLGPC